MAVTKRNIRTSGVYLQDALTRATGGADATADVALGDMAKRHRQMTVPADANPTFPSGTYTVPAGIPDLGSVNDSAAGNGRKAITTAEADILRSAPNARFVGRTATGGAVADKVKLMTPAEAVEALPDATASAAGKMTAAHAEKLDGINPDTEWRMLLVLASGNITSYTPTQNVPFWVGNNMASAAKQSFNAVGLTEFQLRFFSSSAAVSTRYGIVEVSTDGLEWYFPDGTRSRGASSGGVVATSVAADGTAMSTKNPVQIDATATYCDRSVASKALTTPGPQVFTLASQFRVASLLVRPLFVDTAATPAQQVYNRVELWTQNSSIQTIGPGGALTADRVSDAADGSRVIMTGRERTKIREMETRQRGGKYRYPLTGRSPFTWIQSTVFDLTTDFGADNLVADGVTSDDISWTGTGDRAKFINIRDTLKTRPWSDEIDLIIPDNRVVIVEQMFNWSVPCKVNFVGRGDNKTCGIMNSRTTSTSWTNAPFLFNSMTNSGLADVHRWRLAEGVDSTANMKAGDEAFIASNTSDYDAVTVGDLLLFLSRRYVTGNVPVRRWTARVVSKGGGGRINLDRPFPFDFVATTKSTLNSGVDIYYRSDNTLVAGNVFGIMYKSTELLQDPDQAGPGGNESQTYMFHARASMYDMIYGSSAGFPWAGCQLDSEIKGIRNRGDGCGFYGNALQNSLIEDCIVETRGGMSEFGIGSHMNIIRRSRWIHADKYRTERGQGWTLRDGECGCFNLYEDIELDGWNMDRTDMTSEFCMIPVMGANGDVYRRIRMRHNMVPQTGFWLRFIYCVGYSDDSYVGRGNTFEDIRMEFLAENTSFTTTAVVLEGVNNVVRNCELTAGSGSSVTASPGCVVRGDGNRIEDLRLAGNPGLTVDSSASNAVIKRYNGTVSNAGTSSTLVSNGVGNARINNNWALTRQHHQLDLMATRWVEMCQPVADSTAITFASGVSASNTTSESANNFGISVHPVNFGKIRATLRIATALSGANTGNVAPIYRINDGSWCWLDGTLASTTPASLNQVGGISLKSAAGSKILPEVNVPKAIRYMAESDICTFGYGTWGGSAAGSCTFYGFRIQGT